MIDKEKPGAKAGYGHRNTFKKIIDKYRLPYTKKYKGYKVGIYTDIITTINYDLYCVDYNKICEVMLKRSNAIFKAEKALNVLNNVLITNTNKYKFKYLIDCSGSDLFLRKLFNLPLPFRFWISKTKLIRTNDVLDDNYFYYLYGDNGNLEDVYILGKNILQGDWYYSKKVDFNLIKPAKKTFLKTKIQDKKIIRETTSVIPVTPLLPLVYKKRFAFLGDSFGNAVPLSVFGTECALNTSEILTKAIVKDDLKLYEKNWKKKYLDIYIRRLAVKIDLYHNPKLIKKIKRYPNHFDVLRLLKKHPEDYLNFIKDQFKQFKLSKELEDMYPKSRILWLFYHYIYLKMKYFVMNILY
jgi:flavin-dependent dehydrogenase